MAGCWGLNGGYNLPWHFSRGDVVTVVAFSEPNHQPFEVGMHTIFRGLIQWDERDPYFAANRRWFEGLVRKGIAEHSLRQPLLVRKTPCRPRIVGPTSVFYLAALPQECMGQLASFGPA
jgi:hypothetical protein